MVILLHKPETWANVSLIHTFSKFSRVQFYKHHSYHAKRSSFYLIARNMDPKNAHALEAVSSWKRSWKAATFYAVDDSKPTEAAMNEVLDKFGDEYIQICDPVFNTQRRALEKASFCKD